LPPRLFICGNRAAAKFFICFIVLVIPSKKTKQDASKRAA
jgi:hypothetical protein